MRRRRRYSTGRLPGAPLAQTRMTCGVRCGVLSLRSSHLLAHSGSFQAIAQVGPDRRDVFGDLRSQLLHEPIDILLRQASFRPPSPSRTQHRSSMPGREFAVLCTAHTFARADSRCHTYCSDASSLLAATQRRGRGEEVAPCAVCAAAHVTAAPELGARSSPKIITAGRVSRAPCTAGSLCSFIANKVELSQIITRMVHSPRDQPP